MSSLNSIELIGNLGRDPEVRYLPSGDPVANFSIATTETWKDHAGAKQSKTEWHEVSVFGKLAEIVRDYCRKGKQVYLRGSMTYDQWEKDGVKHTKAKVKLSGPGAKLVLLGGKSDGGGRRAEESDEPQQRHPSEDFQVSDDDVPF